MPRFQGLVLALFLLGPIPGTSQGYPVDPGLDVQHYAFSLTLRDSTDLIDGSTDMVVRFLEEGRTEFVLDLVGGEAEGSGGMDVLTVTTGGSPLAFEHRDDRLVVILPRASRVGADEIISIRYRGTPTDGLIIGTNKHGDRTFFGDNWPDRARHWLPVVDHVSDKATVEWLVTAPEDYEVVATGRLLERSDLPDGTEFTHWVSTVPIPPKVMVMGAARFAIRTVGQVGSVPIEAWVYPEDREAGFNDFAVAEQVVQFFQELIGPYPYAKLANVQSRTRYGGMENAGNIFYSERAVRGDGSNEGLIAHEIAHQWFGNSVTESDWPHIWLSEGFATYLTHVYMAAQQDPERLAEGLARDRQTVARFFSQAPRMPLVPATYDDPGELLNQNAYQKGSWVLHMLRRALGEDHFWNGIREYYRRFRDGNASTHDLQTVMEEVSGRPLAAFFHQWTKVPGHPVLAAEWSYDEAEGALNVRIRQSQASESPFQFPLEIGARTPDGGWVTAGTAEVTEVDQTFSLPLDQEPLEVAMDPGVWLLHEGSMQKAGHRTQLGLGGWKGKLQPGNERQHEHR